MRKRTRVKTKILILFLCGAGVAEGSFISGGITDFLREINFAHMETLANAELSPVSWGYVRSGLSPADFGIEGTDGGALINWDLAGTGYRIMYVQISTGDPRNFNYYRVTGLTGSAAVNELVTIDGINARGSISFFGTNAPVKESGGCAGLFAAALATLIWFQRKNTRSRARSA